MRRILSELDQFAHWPDAQRVQALQTLLPRKLLRTVLAECHLSTRFCQRLPDWFLLSFVVGLGLFARDSYRQIFKWLAGFRVGGTPGRSTLCMARQRLGVAPVRRLQELAVPLMAQPSTPGAFHRHYRLMALDSFVLDVADSEENARIFGRPHSRRGDGAFPQVRVLSLCEVGTHLFWRSQIKPGRRGEIPMTQALLRHLQPDMLLLWDRGFLSYDLVRHVTVDRQVPLLARVKKNLIFQPIRRLSDGSFLSKLYASQKHRRRDEGGILVRIIAYTLTDPARVGWGETHRLLTTLRDEKLDSATDLVVLYHERWEHELAIDELKTHQRERPVLRSQTAAGVVQEVYGLLTAHGLVRRVMVEAAKAAGVAPRRISFVGAVKIVRCRLSECPATASGRRRWHERLIAEIAEEVLPPRRDRVHPRVIKKPVSKWPKKRAKHRTKPPPPKRFRETVKILD